ncbi:MAG: hypothetical protein ACRD4Y_18210, partial [Candidatus Acidiferrales bacterium]
SSSAKIKSSTFGCVGRASDYSTQPIAGIWFAKRAIYLDHVHFILNMTEESTPPPGRRANRSEPGIVRHAGSTAIDLLLLD